MTHPDYGKTLEYLYSQLPMYQRQGAPAFKKGLGNTRELCWALGMPQWKFNAIHVGGTNGKGSVSSMLASILKEAGYRTGLYTSPHLADFTERIRIDGRPMSQSEVVEWVDCYRLAIDRIKPSFFELTVGMAFEYFAEQEVDIGIIEVGMGGRLDSTNVIKPEVSVITNVGWDHMDMLGDTLPKIATEKAGIIKKFTPTVIGKHHPETDPVFEQVAAEQESELFFAADHCQVQPVAGPDGYQSFQVGEETYELDLLGHYQAENLATVLMTVAQMRENGWEIPATAVRKGLRKVIANSGLRGRMERLQSHPTVLCDVAHNLNGIQAILPQILGMPYQKLHLVWGMVKEKDHDRILAELPQEAQYYFVKPSTPRGYDTQALADKAQAHGLSGRVCHTLQQGLTEALQAATPEDLIFVGGSSFVVADLLALWRESEAV